MGLVQSCKRLVNEPFAYLQDVLERVSIHRASRVDDLLPDHQVLPEPGALAGRKDRFRPGDAVPPQTLKSPGKDGRG